MAKKQAVVGPKIYKVSLLRVAPGKESEVAGKLTAAIEQETDTKPLCVLKLFGSYDLCAIYEMPDIQTGPSHAGSIPHIRGGNQIISFPWVQSPNSRLEMAADHKVWGLLFFKINEHLAQRYGALIDDILARHWLKFHGREVNVHTFGTTGWSELLLLVTGKSFSGVATTLSSISQQEVIVGRETDLFSAKTFSIIGIDFELTNPANRGRLLSSFREQFEYNKGTFPQLRITCAPGCMADVSAYANKHLGSGFSTFGTYDLLFRPEKMRTWGSFIAEVFDMRKSLAGKLYSTSIDMLVTPGNEVAFSNHPNPRIANRGIPVLKSTMGLFEKWGPRFSNALKNLYLGIGNLIQDPLTGGCFEDMRPTLETRLPEFLRRLAGTRDQDEQNMAGEIIEALCYGAQERANGAFLTLEHMEAQFSPTKGGIQRVLRAVSSLPKALLDRASLPWYGFVIAGYQNSGFSSRGDIINFPHSQILSPDEWWGLFHEVGHVALWNTSLVNMDGSEIQDMLRAAVGDNPNSDRYIDWKALFMEIGADMFDLYFCYGREFDLYLRNILGYIVTNGRLQKQHCIRYFSIFKYWEQLLIPKRKAFPGSTENLSGVQPFREKLSRLGYKNAFPEEYDRECLYAFERLRQVITHYHLRFSQVAPPRSLARDLDSNNLKRALDNTFKSQVFLERIVHPDAFVIALKCNQPKLKFSMRIAAVLSLWHTATLQAPHRPISRSRTGQ